MRSQGPSTHRRRRAWLAVGYAVALPLLVAFGGIDYAQLLTGVGLPERVGARMQLIAHRGDVERFPENTLEGIISAAALEVDGIELDVHPSADGTWWVIHDSTLDRTTDATGPIAAQRDSEIEAAVVNGGAGYIEERHAGMRLPKLSDVVDALDAFDGVLIVDLQHAGTGPLERLVELLPPQSIVLSPDVETAEALEQRDHGLRTAIRHRPALGNAADFWLAEAVHEATVGNVGSAGLPVIAFLDEWRFGHGEETAIRRAWAAGVHAFLTKAPRAAMAVVQDLESSR